MPGQGSLNVTVFTAILQCGLPSHISLTFTSESGDLQSVVRICEWLHTILPSVLPNIAFSIKMFPLGQVKFMMLPSHFLSFPLKNMKNLLILLNLKKIKRNENG